MVNWIYHVVTVREHTVEGIYHVLKSEEHMVNRIYHMIPPRHHVLKWQDDVVKWNYHVLKRFYHVVISKNHVLKRIYHVVNLKSDMAQSWKTLVFTLKPSLLTKTGQKAAVGAWSDSVMAIWQHQDGWKRLYVSPELED